MARQVFTGLEADFEGLSLVVHFSTEADGESKAGRKRIKLKTLTASTDVAALAEEILEHCPIIPPSKLGSVERRLRQLQPRADSSEEGSSDGSSEEEDARMSSHGRALSVRNKGESVRGRQAAKPDSRLSSAKSRDRNVPMNSALDVNLARGGGVGGGEVNDVELDHVNIEALDEYMEGLYDDEMAVRVKATWRIMRLASMPEHMETFVSNRRLLQALVRVVREDGKKSTDLVNNIVGCFLVFSHFSDFHPVLHEAFAELQPSLMKLCDLEMRRGSAREADSSSASSEADRAKAFFLLQKSERFLYVGFYTLLNFSEHIDIERVAVRSGVVALLSSALDFKNIELLVLAVTFLHRLSVYQENVVSILKAGALKKLASLVPNPNQLLLITVLRIVGNLVLDKDARLELISLGLVSRCRELVKRPSVRGVVLHILYHLSVDPKGRHSFAKSDTLWTVVNQAIEILQESNDPNNAEREGKRLGDRSLDGVVLALLVNLSADDKCTQAIFAEQSGTLEDLLEGLMGSGHMLCIKVVRNFAESRHTQHVVGKYVSKLVAVLANGQGTGSTALVFEVLRALNALGPFTNAKDADDIFDICTHLIVAGEAADDVLLESIMLLATLIAEKESMAVAAAQHGVHEVLEGILQSRPDDGDLCVQAMFTLCQLLAYPAIRGPILDEGELLNTLVGLMDSHLEPLVELADQALELVGEGKSDWADEVRSLKFAAHNENWLEIAGQDSMLVGLSEGGYDPYA